MANSIAKFPLLQFATIVVLSIATGDLFAQSRIRTEDLDSKIPAIRFETITVDREQGQYLGHPTTCLLDDGKTILCVYPQGHGRGPIVYKRSADGGKTWSERIKTPANWRTSKETPTLHRVVDKNGKKRIIMFSGLYPIRMAVTEDEGKQWSELKPIGDFGGIVTMSTVSELKTGPGHYMAMFHDDGRFIAADSKSKNPVEFSLFKTLSTDGGLTWSKPETIHVSTEKHICEPCVIRSPDQKRLVCLLRENSRRHPSQYMTSDDEGKTWSELKPLQKWLHGDRHATKYLNDGRLFISFRCVWPSNKHDFDGDWVAWVGSFEDLVAGNDGDWFIRLSYNHVRADCGYPGVEVLPTGTVVATTYGHWEKGEQPFIRTIRIPPYSFVRARDAVEQTKSKSSRK